MDAHETGFGQYPSLDDELRAHRPVTPPAAPHALEAELRAVAARLKDVSKLLASEFGDDDLDKDQIKADLATLTRAAATIARMREALDEIGAHYHTHGTHCAGCRARTALGEKAGSE